MSPGTESSGEKGFRVADARSVTKKNVATKSLIIRKFNLNETRKVFDM
jgi:hypothetical protein